MDIFSSKDDQFLGRSSILPQQLKDDAGRLILTVFNKEMLPVGVIQCELKDTLPAWLWQVQAHTFSRKSEYRISGNIGGHKIWRFARNLAKMHYWRN